ncbi:hypothetical protein SAMN02745245_00454 [Anaerosphaera aminiphila DSM 21120]|uniref:Uncharacterized protein n=1 Tax=Anaerosphaera aminiphila DSM 21120 TaxID=1120995 RepID=A0A1M5PSH5_9FIRM|nr:hypothetical protein [Anaerosphaera aminiphila]SHH04805.1 hypothetical protein SAMN02745245_00454 [Anaerosphaera aminiphila DSM 21120]
MNPRNKKSKTKKDENNKKIRLCCGSDLYKNTIENYVNRRISVEENLEKKK